LKYNLKNRPKITETEYKHFKEKFPSIGWEQKTLIQMHEWVEGFEKELRERLEKHQKSYERIKHPIRLKATILIEEILGE